MATATKKEEIFNDEIILNDPTTVRTEEKKSGYQGPTASIFLPKLEEEGSGIKVDQIEHVTISNEEKEERWLVKRGVHVDVPVPVYVILKAKYPDI